MVDESNNHRTWTDAERHAVRKLLRMAGTLLTAIIIAGIFAAILSSALGTL